MDDKPRKVGVKVRFKGDLELPDFLLRYFPDSNHLTIMKMANNEVLGAMTFEGFFEKDFKEIAKAFLSMGKHLRVTRENRDKS